MRYLFLLLLFSLISFGVSAQMVELTDLNGAKRSVSVKMIRIVYSSGSGSLVQYVDSRRNFNVKEYVTDIASNGCNYFLVVIKGRDTMLVNKDKVETYYSTGTSKSRIVVTDGFGYINSDMSYAEVDSQMVINPGCVSTGGTVTKVAKSEEYRGLIEIAGDSIGLDIDGLPVDSTLIGDEIIFFHDKLDNSNKSITVNNLKSFIIDTIESVSGFVKVILSGSMSGTGSIYSKGKVVFFNGDKIGLAANTDSTLAQMIVYKQDSDTIYLCNNCSISYDSSFIDGSYLYVSNDGILDTINSGYLSGFVIPGGNIYFSSNYSKTVNGSAISYPISLIFNDTISCPSLSGVFYNDVIQSDSLVIYADDINSINGCEGMLRITSDGVNPIILNGFEYTHGISSGDILSNYTYECTFRKNPWGMTFEVKEPSIIYIPSNPLENSDSILVRDIDSVLIAFSGRWSDLITDSSGYVKELKMPNSPIYSIVQDEYRPYFDTGKGSLHFDTSSIRADTAKYFLDSLFKQSYTFIAVVDVDTNNYIHRLYDIIGNYDSGTGDYFNIANSIKGNALLSRSYLVEHKTHITTNAVDEEFGVSGSTDTTKHIIAIVYDGVARTLSAWKNGSKLLSSTPFDTPLGSSNGIVNYFNIGMGINGVGDYNISNTMYKGDLFYFLFYRKAMDDTSVNEKLNHLNDIYNVY